MKKLFITLAVISCFVTTLSAQAPIQYSVARTDTNNTPGYPIVPGSAWGGPTGAGTKWCFSQSTYKGICIWRLTDTNTFSGSASAQTPDNELDGSGQTPDNQADNIVSAPVASTRYIIAEATGSGPSYIVAFDR